MKSQFPNPARQAFSMIELLVSMTILSAILLMFVGLLDQTQKTWEFSQGQISQFREARLSFDVMTKNLSQATLNPYFEQVDEDGKRAADFADNPTDFRPARYEIQSELHFVSMQARDLKKVSGFDQVGPGQAVFFQAPLGTTAKVDRSGGLRYGQLTNLLTSRGYFVAYGSDRKYRPPFLSEFNIPEKKRYRLMEFLPTTESNLVYVDHFDSASSEAEKFEKWYETPLASSGNEEFLRPLAENIVALILSPREPVTDSGGDVGDKERWNAEATRRIAPRYEFDSENPVDATFKHSLPPLMLVTMVAIDETSALRLEDRYGNAPYMASSGSTSFLPGNWMTEADTYHKDLEEMIDRFNEEATRDGGIPIRYKVFSSTVRINGSKWSDTTFRPTSP